MRNKKGFTLTEILIVILLISIILVITIPSIIAVRRSIKTRELETKKELLISAAEVYAQNNQSLFPKEGGIIEIPVRTLVYYGYLNSDETTDNCDETIGCVINPVDDTSMNDEIITIKKIKSVTQATWGTVDTYKATFYANGATVRGATDSITIGCDTFSGTCTIKTPLIERDNYNVIGWGISANVETKSLNVNESIVINSNVSYYAVTSKNVTVTFDPNGGTFVSGNNDVRSCTKYNTTSSCNIGSNDPELNNRIGYEFEGWYDSASGGTKVTTRTFENNQTLYAHWKLVGYTVTLDMQGGTGGTTSVFAIYGSAMPSATMPTRSGYTFGGYYTGTKGNGTQYYTSSGSSARNWDINSATTLYAKWTGNCGSNKYNPNTEKCEYESIKKYSCVRSGYSGGCRCSVMENLLGSQRAYIATIDCGSYGSCSAACASLAGTRTSSIYMSGSCTAGKRCSGANTAYTCSNNGCIGNDGNCHLYSMASCPSDYSISGTTPTCPTVGPHNDVQLSGTTCSYTP